MIKLTRQDDLTFVYWNPNNIVRMTPDGTGTDILDVLGSIIAVTQSPEDIVALINTVQHITIGNLLKKINEL